MPITADPSVHASGNALFGCGHPSDALTARLATLTGVQRVPTTKLALFQHRHFLAPDICTALINRIDTLRRPSTLSDANGDPTYRTSETCDLDPADPVVAGVDKRITDLMGLDPRHGEPIQGQRYAVGQQFKGHTDYFEPLGVDYERYCGVAGQRTWTVMLYLNEPVAGGATRFTAIDKIVQPETGKLLSWNNRRADGSLNPDTIHQGMKVRSGVKYVITKWFRERAWGW